MNNLSDMFGGFRQEDMKNDFLAIQMEALAKADQRDMNINAEKAKDNDYFSDATGEAIDVSANLEGFDALAEEALGIDGFVDMEFATEGDDFAGKPDMNDPKMKKMLEEQKRKAGLNKPGATAEGYEFASEGKKACTCGQCKECASRSKANEEWEFGTEDAGPEISRIIDSIPESTVEECVDTFRALDDSLDGTAQQQAVRESLAVQLDLLIPNY